MPRQHGSKGLLEFFEDKLRTETNPKFIKFYQMRISELGGGSIPTSLNTLEMERRPHYNGPDHREQTMPWRLDEVSTRLFHTKHRLTPAQYFDRSKDRGPLGLALETCHQCAGFGVKKYGKYCSCVYRQVGKDLLMRYLQQLNGIPGQVTLHMGASGPFTQMSRSNFSADLDLALSVIFNTQELFIWDHHLVGVIQPPVYTKDDPVVHVDSEGNKYVLAKPTNGRLVRTPWKPMIEKLNAKFKPEHPWNRGEFFHHLYRMLQKLGQIAIDRGLFPTGWYFSEKRLTRDMIGETGATGGAWKKDQWLNGGHYEEMLKVHPVTKREPAPQFNPAYRRREEDGVEVSDKQRRRDRQKAVRDERLRVLREKNPAHYAAVQDSRKLDKEMVIGPRGGLSRKKNDAPPEAE